MQFDAAISDPLLASTQTRDLRITPSPQVTEHGMSVKLDQAKKIYIFLSCNSIAIFYVGCPILVKFVKVWSANRNYSANLQSFADTMQKPTCHTSSPFWVNFAHEDPLPKLVHTIWFHWRINVWDMYEIGNVSRILCFYKFMVATSIRGLALHKFNVIKKKIKPVLEVCYTTFCVFCKVLYDLLCNSPNWLYLWPCNTSCC